jgi:tetratricopeptide (TPR) repeat protein
LKALLVIALALLVTGCASSERFLWEEYTNEGLAAFRAGQFNRAEAYLNRAAQKAEELGPVEMGRSLNNLGELNRRRAQAASGAERRARAAEAERLFRRSLAVKEAGIGPDSPDVATTLNNLAQLYAADGRVQDAMPLLERSLAIQEKTLDAEHPALARTLRGLAAMYRTVGRDHDAFVLETRAHLLRAIETPRE